MVFMTLCKLHYRVLLRCLGTGPRGPNRHNDQIAALVFKEYIVKLQSLWGERSLPRPFTKSRSMCRRFYRTHPEALSRRSRQRARASLPGSAARAVEIEPTVPPPLMRVPGAFDPRSAAASVLWGGRDNFP
jgi:hypothetical protein